MNLLPRNEHTIDRLIRVVIGLAVLSLFFIGPKTPWALLGLIPFVTGAVGSCPVYALFGVSTCAPQGPRTPKTVA